MKAFESSISPFASKTVLVKQKDETMRLYISYRKLNSITKKDAHQLSRIEDIFDTLSKSKIFFTLDLAMKYYQTMNRYTPTFEKRRCIPLRLIFSLQSNDIQTCN